MKQCAAFIQVSVRSAFWNFSDPSDAGLRDASIVRVRAQRARAWCEQAVQSNGGERAVPRDPISTDKRSFHEAHIRVKLVAARRPRSQVRPCSSQIEISLTNHTVEIENGRRIAAVGMRTSGIRGGRGSLYWSREEEVE